MEASGARSLLRGVRAAYRRAVSEPGAAPVVLMYHRVARPRFDPWGLAVSPDRFREQIEMLAGERAVMKLAELVGALATGRAPRYATALTFDDGYRDNVEAAGPVLSDAVVPATLFVTTGRIGAGRPFWWDELAALMPEPAAYHAQWRKLAVLGEAAREAALERLRSDTDRPGTGTEALPVDAAMLRAAAAGPFEIGSHARSHTALPLLDPARRREEIAGSRRELEALLGHAPRGFAYPHGAFDRDTARMVEDAGFEWAVAVGNRAVSRRGFDRFALPRLTVGDWSAERLRREIRNLGG